MRVLVCGAPPRSGVWDAWIERVKPTSILVVGRMPDWFGPVSRLPAIVHTHPDYTFENVCRLARPDLVLHFALYPRQPDGAMAGVPTLHVWGPDKADCILARPTCESAA